MRQLREKGPVLQNHFRESPLTLLQHQDPALEQVIVDQFRRLRLASAPEPIKALEFQVVTAMEEDVSTSIPTTRWMKGQPQPPRTSLPHLLAAGLKLPQFLGSIRAQH